MGLSEFQIIKSFFSGSPPSSHVIKGIGDDAALVHPAEGSLVLCCDTLVEGVHFPRGTTGYDIGYKALAVNLSDIAAMGAKPLYFLLSITLPFNDPVFCKSIAEGLQALAGPLNVPLIGGDTTRGPLSITVTAFGQVEPSKALLRDKAQVGDKIYVVDTVGGAAFGLSIHMDKHEAGSVEDEVTVMKLLNRPSPCLAMGQALVGLANSAIDVSDGLLQDVGHILEQSAKGAVVDLANIPIHPALNGLNQQERYDLALAGGDDYTLVFTANQANEPAIRAKAQALGHQIQCIGVVTQDEGITFENLPVGVLLSATGYQHF